VKVNVFYLMYFFLQLGHCKDVFFHLLNNEDPDPVLANFTDWCKLSLLDINVFKTRDDSRF